MSSATISVTFIFNEESGVTVPEDLVGRVVTSLAEMTMRPGWKLEKIDDSTDLLDRREHPQLAIAFTVSMSNPRIEVGSASEIHTMRLAARNQIARKFRLKQHLPMQGPKSSEANGSYSDSYVMNPGALEALINKFQ